MKKATDILCFNFPLILGHWIFYRRISDKLGIFEVTFIIVTTLVSVILASIMYARKFSLAYYWSFAKKHPYICNFTSILIFSRALNYSLNLLPNYNLWVLVFLDFSILFGIMIKDEVKKHVKVDFEQPD